MKKLLSLAIIVALIAAVVTCPGEEAHKEAIMNEMENSITILWLILFALTLAALCMFFFLSSTMLRKVGFFGSIVLFIFVLCANIFAYQQKQRQLYHDHAIVFDSSISGKSSPNQAGKELFLLHEGTNVTIIDTSVKNWLQVRLPDGKQGWIPASSVEVI